jgi:hypothetical protein
MSLQGHRRTTTAVSLRMAHWPERHAASISNAIEIDRRSRLSPDETMGRYMAGEGRPVIVTDAQSTWRAKELWSLEYFRTHYASEALIASDRAPLRREDNPPMTTLKTTLGEYIDYMTTPHHALASHERDAPFYGNSWSPFIEHAELRGHIARPYFVPDAVPTEANYERLDRSFTKIFLGPPGTVTRLHNDTYHTHAWLSQIRGRKQFVLYPPSQGSLIHAGEGLEGNHGASQTLLDPLAPDYDAFPRVRNATPYVAVCEPGDTILVPADWYHYAIALTPSITLMRNFMNDANADAFMHEWNNQEPPVPKRMPAMMSPTPFPPPTLPPPKPGLREPTMPIAPGERGIGDSAEFQSARCFQGARFGRVFKMGDKGLGYYRDHPAAVVASTGLVATTIDHGRTVHRISSATTHSPARRGDAFTHISHNRGHGAACFVATPTQNPCARRVGTTSSWSATRHVPGR